MRDLGKASNDVTDGVDAGFGGFSSFVHFYESAVDFDPRLFNTGVGNAWSAADRDEDFLGFLLDGFAGARGPGDLDTSFRLFDLLNLRAGVDVDAALLEDTGELFGDLFVLEGHDTRQEFDQRHLGAEAAEDRGEFNTDGAGADYDERFGHLRNGENLDVGEDAAVRLQTEDGLGVRARREDHVLRFDLRFCSVGSREIDGVDAVFSAAGQAAIAGDHGDLVLLHQKAEALGVFFDDGGLALLDGIPVERAAVYVADTI